MCVHDSERSTLDCNYSPSHHALLPYDKVLSDYIAKALTIFGTIKKDETIAIETVKYGDGENECVDVYDLKGVAKDEVKKMVVFIHGGYWTEGARQGAAQSALVLPSRGIAFATVGYELVKLSANRTLLDLMDAQLVALKALHSQYPNAELIVGGHSAGAQLAAKAIEHLPDPKSIGIQKVFLLSGIFDLRALPDTYIGREMGLTAEQAELGSIDEAAFLKALKSLDAENSSRNLLIALGDHDAPVFLEQSRRLAEKAGVGSKFYQVLKGDDHFSFINKLADANAEGTKLLIDFCTR